MDTVTTDPVTTREEWDAAVSAVAAVFAKAERDGQEPSKAT